MIHYEVRVLVRADLAASFESYMRTRHLPEILATGCFEGIRFEQGEGGTYRTCYQASSKSALEAYLLEHAGPLRKDFRAHFPEGCEVRREIWAEVQTFR